MEGDHARFQPGDDVHFHIVCGQQDDRYGARAAHLRKQREAAAVGQIDVQNQQVKAGLRQRIPRFGQRAADGDLDFRALQRQPNAAAERGVILQKQNPLHGGSLSCAFVFFLS